MNKIKFILGALSLLFTSVTHATIVDFKWEGRSGYTLLGEFEYLDSLDGLGLIDEGDLDAFTFSLFFPTSQIFGTWSMDTPSPSDYVQNFNFDTTSKEFVYGGHYNTDPYHIAWGGSQLGFIGGDGANVMKINGLTADFQFVSKENFIILNVEPGSVSEPSIIALFAVSLIGIGSARRRVRS